MSTPRRNPCELEIDLFCHGARIDPSCTLLEDARKVSRTRAGLGSGLELVIPGPLKDIWMNVPVEEDFAQASPYVLAKGERGYFVRDGRSGQVYDVRIPEEPAWYERRTSRGTEMCRVGVLQGTYLGIYISNSCLFWYTNPSQNCHFCTTGSNVGVNEVADKDLEDVVEVARAAKEESGITFVHLNSGYQAGRDLEAAAPYVRALKERVGVLVGLQLVPSREFSEYDRLIDLGTDHFSFCYEFHNPEYFERLLPGKTRTFGQRAFFDAMEYTAKKLGKGAVSGEIIAGVEPVEDTLRAIDYITGVGAFPTVCIFRPVIGSDMETHPSPRYEEMRAVFAHVYEACRKHGIPIGAAPGIEVSLIVQPDDTRYLARPGPRTWLYETRLRATRMLAGPIFTRKMKPRRTPGIPGGSESDEAGSRSVLREALDRMGAGNGQDASASDRDRSARPAAENHHGDSLRSSREAVFALIHEAVRTAPDRFEIKESPGILEIVPLNRIKDASNRCRLKLFRPREDKERLCAFFYKRSNLTWSRDRFSYGAVEFRPEQLTREDVQGWLQWLSEGFDPSLRPTRLRRAFLYTIPD